MGLLTATANASTRTKQCTLVDGQAGRGAAQATTSTQMERPTKESGMTTCERVRVRQPLSKFINDS